MSENRDRDQAASGGMWFFLKNISNKFSIPDFMNGNGNDKKSGASSSSSRKRYSYGKLETNDNSDFLTSENPNLLDMLGKEKDANSSQSHDLDQDDQDFYFKSEEKVDPSAKGNKSPLPFNSNMNCNPTRTKPDPPTSTSGLTSRFGTLTIFKNGKNVDFKLKEKTFTFPNQVPSSSKSPHITENSLTLTSTKDWTGIEDSHGQQSESETSSSCSSDYEDDEDDEEFRNGTRCQICGCEKRYEVTGTSEKYGV